MTFPNFLVVNLLNVNFEIQMINELKMMGIQGDSLSLEVKSIEPSFLFYNLPSCFM